MAKQFKTLGTGIVIYRIPQKNGATRIEVLTPSQVTTNQKWWEKLLNKRINL